MFVKNRGSEWYVVCLKCAGEAGSPNIGRRAGEVSFGFSGSNTVLITEGRVWIDAGTFRDVSERWCADMKRWTRGQSVCKQSGEYAWAGCSNPGNRWSGELRPEHCLQLKPTSAQHSHSTQAGLCSWGDSRCLSTHQIRLLPEWNKFSFSAIWVEQIDRSHMTKSCEYFPKLNWIALLSVAHWNWYKFCLKSNLKQYYNLLWSFNWRD